VYEVSADEGRSHVVVLLGFATGRAEGLVAAATLHAAIPRDITALRAAP
jgi:hypothetical protein